MIQTHTFYFSVPYYAVPWAATTIVHRPSFLTIHGLFFLTRRREPFLYTVRPNVH